MEGVIIMVVYCSECGTENNFDNVYCQQCGKPLHVEKSEVKHVEEKRYSGSIAAGYIFSFLGGWIGLALAIYLVTRDDARAKYHGKINLLILFTWMAIVGLIISIYVGIVLFLVDIVLFYLVLTKKV